MLEFHYICASSVVSQKSFRKVNDNNNIGADNSSQILTELIRFAHSLDRL